MEGACADDFEDAHDLVYYPSGTMEVVAQGRAPTSGSLFQPLYRDFIDAAEIPSSVRSLSRYSPDVFSAGNPFAQARPSALDNDRPLSNPPVDFTQVRDSLASPPSTPTCSQYSVSRFRSPLAGPPSYCLYPHSPTETVVGSPDLMKHYSSMKIKKRPPFKSTALLDLHRNPIYKPWLNQKDFLEYVSYWLTLSMVLFMASASALIMLVNLSQLDNVGDLCLVLHDDFENGLDRNTWFHEVDMGGFGNGEFEMMTGHPNNSYVEDGVLYLVPTLTSDEIGREAIFDGHIYNITGCTNGNLTECGRVSNSTLRSVINPVQSARLTTRYSHAIQYGRVEVRARLPRGDWLWPAIWMLPADNEYGPWPVSGEIDIMESRGNGFEYPFQGRNYVRTSLNWGPVNFINAVAKTFGWFSGRRLDFSEDYHTFVLEWSDRFLRSYVDTPLHQMFEIKFDKPFFERGDFPLTALNGSEPVAILDPWKDSGSNSAPFDKPFYLIMNVAVGGRNGWFPDTLGGKMWFDGSPEAMYEFAKAQEVWRSTWPEDPRQRGMAIDYVKMWQKC
ncbi:hypothetical protein ACEPAF_7291 [Sanghuangporus sanghuang]